MEKQKSWQLYLIIAVLALTLYNILPTIFFYSKPLSSPIDAPKAEHVASAIVERVNQVEADSKEWLASFSKLLGIKPASIDLVTTNPGLIQVAFKDEKDAALFKRFLPRAGALIPFAPAQLELSPESASSDNTNVYVQRNIAVQLNPGEVNQLFHFTPKYASEGKVADLYRDIVYDRATQIAWAVGGPSKTALQLSAIVNHPKDPAYDEAAIALAKEIVDVDSVFGKNSAVTKRYYGSFSQGSSKAGENLPQKFLTQLDELNKKVKEQRDALRKTVTSGETLDTVQEQELAVLNNQATALEASTAILRKQMSDFQTGSKPLTIEGIQNLLTRSQNNALVQTVDLEGHNPFIKGLTIDWDSSLVKIDLYPDVQALRFQEGKTEKEAFVREKVNQFLINDIARVARLTDENFKPSEDTFVVNLDTLSNSQSYLTFDLGFVAQKRAQQVMDQLLLSWVPSRPTLSGKPIPSARLMPIRAQNPKSRSSAW